MADIRVGTASWTDKTLIESGWYPPEANNPEKRLRYYTRQFPLVEVDSTYYALPAEQTAAAWAHRSPQGFTFNIKSFSLFTQHPTRVAALPKDLRPAVEKAAGGKPNVYLKDVDPEVTNEAWERFLAALEPLRLTGRLGAILFQFPQWFVIGRARSLMVASIIGFLGVAVMFLGVALMFLHGLQQQAIWFGIIALFILANCWRGLQHARILARAARLPRRDGFKCPSCETAPPIGAWWACGRCGKPFDTFETQAVCPHCGAQFEGTRCLDCGEMHSIEAWRIPPPPVA